MPVDPLAMPATTTVTSLLAEPLKLAGLAVFAPGEVRTITLSAFEVSQRVFVWNGLFNAKVKNLISGVDLVDAADEIATGHQGVQNRGGQGVGGGTKNEPGGFGLPASVVITNLIGETLSIAGITIKPGVVFTLNTTLLPINQQSAVWNALIQARNVGLISSPQLTVSVTDGFTGHQGIADHGGQGNGGQVAVLVDNLAGNLGVRGQPVTVRGQTITVRGQ